jgi:prefoldin subunit 4
MIVRSCKAPLIQFPRSWLTRAARYRIGETFIHLPLPRAQKRIAKDQEVLDQRIAALNERTEAHENEMKELKVQLYAKFGRQINLD